MDVEKDLFLNVIKESTLKLNSHRDPYLQGDAATDVFDGWRAVAGQFAKNYHSDDKCKLLMLQVTRIALNFLSCEHCPELLTNAHTDDYVTRNLMQSFGQILQLMASKAKLVACLHGHRDIRPSAADTVDGPVFDPEMGRRLAAATLSAGTPVPLRVHYLSGLRALVQFVGSAATAMNDDGDVDPLSLLLPIIDKVPRDSVVLTAVDSRLTSVHRNAAEQVLAAFAALPKPHGPTHCRQIAELVSRRAVDSQALDLVWQPPYHGMDLPSVVETVRARVRASAAQDQQRQSVQRGTGQDMDALPLQVLNSLSQTINNGTLGSGPTLNSYAPHVLALARDCDAVITNVYKESTTQSSSSSSSNTGADNNVERSAEMVELLGCLLRELPDNEDVLKLALHPPTVECVALAQTASAAFSEHTWLTLLLPYLNARMDQMSLHGVSGDPLHQEIVDFVRECARIYYINRDHFPSLDLGSALFHAILNAVRHGYVETERFPMLLAAIVRFHCSDPAFTDDCLHQWITDALSNRVCHNTTAARAVRDVFVRLLGLSDDDDGVNVAPLDRNQTVRVARALAGTVSDSGAAAVAVSVWSATICPVAPSFVRSLPVDVLATLVRSVRDQLGRRRPGPRFVEAAGVLVRELCNLCAPAHAVQLFELAVEVFASTQQQQQLQQQQGKGQHHHHDVWLGPASLGAGGADDTLSRVLRKVPHADAYRLSATAIRQALAHGGPLTREALAAFVPDLCLQDPSPVVRAAALSALTMRSDLLPQLADAVLRAALGGVDKDNPDVSSADRGLGLGDLDLLLAAAPCCARLAVVHRPSLVDCLDVLVRAAKISALNHPQEHVHPTVLRSLDLLAEYQTDVDLAEMAGSSKRAAVLLDKAAKISDSWKVGRARLVRAKVLVPAAAAASPGQQQKQKKERKKEKKSTKSAYVVDQSAIAALKQTMATTNLSALQKTSTTAAGTAAVVAAAAADGDSVLLVKIEDLLNTVDGGLSALRLLHELRTRFPDQFADRGRALLRDRVLPAIAEQALPKPVKKPGSNGDVEFPVDQLNRFSALLKVMREVQSLFYSEAESVLGMNQRILDFAAAEVRRRLLAPGSVNATRDWLRTENLTDPSLLVMCNAAELDALLPPVESHIPERAPAVQQQEGRTEPGMRHESIALDSKTHAIPAYY